MKLSIRVIKRLPWLAHWQFVRKAVKDQCSSDPSLPGRLGQEVPITNTLCKIFILCWNSEHFPPVSIPLPMMDSHSPCILAKGRLVSINIYQAVMVTSTGLLQRSWQRSNGDNGREIGSRLSLRWLPTQVIPWFSSRAIWCFPGLIKWLVKLCAPNGTKRIGLLYRTQECL